MRLLPPAAILAASLGAITASASTPLALTYTVTTTAPLSYHYAFALRLDDDDGSWAPGQQFDWIVFGDRPEVGQPSGFKLDFSNFMTVDPLAYGFSGGGHEGPTVGYGDNFVSLPGWTPSAVGQALTWSGDSHTLLPAGTLYWSSLIGGGGAKPASFVLATLSTAPEPAVWTLTIAGFGLVGARLRSHRMVAA